MFKPTMVEIPAFFFWGGGGGGGGGLKMVKFLAFNIW